MYEELKERYGEEVARNIQDLFDELRESGKYEFMDNERVMIDGNVEEEEKYREKIFNGCCGFYDEWFLIFGKTYRIGFNYGH